MRRRKCFAPCIEDVFKIFLFLFCSVDFDVLKIRVPLNIHVLLSLRGLITKVNKSFLTTLSVTYMYVCVCPCYFSLTPELVLSKNGSPQTLVTEFVYLTRGPAHHCFRYLFTSAYLTVTY